MLCAYHLVHIPGYNYDNGIGVARDEAEAVKLYKPAADEGHAGAQHNLGKMNSSLRICYHVIAY